MPRSPLFVILSPKPGRQPPRLQPKDVHRSPVGRFQQRAPETTLGRGCLLARETDHPRARKDRSAMQIDRVLRGIVYSEVEMASPSAPIVPAPRSGSATETATTQSLPQPPTAPHRY